MASNNNNKNNIVGAAVAPNAPFSALVSRKTTAEGALAAEDHATNPWTSPSRPRSEQYFAIRETARRLPAASCRKDFLDLYHKNQVIVLTGDTGSGKTTQVPQFILYDDLPVLGPSGTQHKKIVCTQPRRVAAMEVAGRVASELDVDLGAEVGYHFRGENASGLRTLLLYTTDGHLLQELKNDRDLKQYSCIIIDEAHERTIASDFLLGLLRSTCSRRRDLKLIVMSATMNANKFRAYFNGAPIFTIPGRTFPVQVYHQDIATALGNERHLTVPHYVAAAVRTVAYITENEPAGDILVFMPGQEDIAMTITGINNETQNVVAFGLFSDMSKEHQKQALAPLDGTKVHFRKCVVATNIAETSLTIDGIVYVVDCGLEKVMTYNPRLRMDMLLVAPTSQAAANQRKGRAGRTRPGKCFRLYSKHHFENALTKEALPEIQRCNMQGPILDLLVLRGGAATCDDIMTFPYIDPPTPEDDLTFMGLLNDLGQVSSDGRLASKLPLEPRHAAAFIRACNSKPSPVWEVSAIVSLLNEDRIFLQAGPQNTWSTLVQVTFKHQDGDAMTLLNIWHAFHHQVQVCAKRSPLARAEHLYQWCRAHFLSYEGLTNAGRTFEALLATAHKEMRMQPHQKIMPANRDTWSCPRISEVVRKTLLKAGFMQIAVKEPRGDGYRTLGENNPGLIFTTSSIVNREYNFVMYDTFLRTNKCFFVNATGIDAQWLFEDPLSAAHVNRLLSDYIPNSQKWFPLKQLAAEKAKFERSN